TGLLRVGKVLVEPPTDHLSTRTIDIEVVVAEVVESWPPEMISVYQLVDPLDVGEMFKVRRSVGRVLLVIEEVYCPVHLDIGVHPSPELFVGAVECQTAPQQQRADCGENDHPRFHVLVSCQFRCRVSSTVR